MSQEILYCNGTIRTMASHRAEEAMLIRDGRVAAAWMGASSCSQPAGGSEGGGTGTAWREPEPEQAPAGEREEQLQWYSEKLEECRTSEEFLGMLDQFSYRSASALLAGGESSANENYSPLSLYYALGMTAAGAEGETLEELGQERQILLFTCHGREAAWQTGKQAK